MGCSTNTFLSSAVGDGIVVQDLGKGDMEGYNDSNEEPDRKGAESAVQAAAELFGRMSTLTAAS